MNARHHYLAKAAELHAKASEEKNPLIRIEFENLARSYLRLAEQAERNSHLDAGCETPPKEDGPSGRFGGSQ